MISKDSRKVVGEYVFLSKYSQTHTTVLKKHGTRLLTVS